MASPFVKRAAGLTLPEILVSIALAGILIGGISLLVTRSFGLSRIQYEQSRIVEDGRTELARITQAIRDAHEGPSGQAWLIAGGPYQLAIFTNADNDSDTEQVRYFLENTDLQRGVINPVGGVYPAENEQISVLARSVRNLEQLRPLFTYETAATLPTKVGLTLLVDVNVSQAPPQAEMKTEVVVPREINSQLSLAPTTTPPSPGECTPGTVCPGGLLCQSDGTCPANNLICPLPVPASACEALYAGTNGSEAVVYRYDGLTQWKAVGSFPNNDSVSALVSYWDSTASTYRMLAGTNKTGNIFRYNGVNDWVSTGFSFPGVKTITALSFVNGQLYAGTDQVGHVFRYTNGTQWDDIGQPGGGQTVRVNALIHYNGKLYAGVGPAARVFRYDGGTTWTDVSGLFGSPGEVMSLASHFDGYLYAGLSKELGVYRSLGGGNWQASGGPGGTSADVPALLGGYYSLESQTLPSMFAVNLFAAASSNQGEVYTYHGGTDWLLIGNFGQRAVHDLKIFADNLIAATGGNRAEAFYYQQATSAWLSLGAIGPASTKDATSMTVRSCDPFDCPRGYKACDTTSCVPANNACL